MNDKQCQLVEDNLNLVYFIIRKEYPTFLGDEDLVQSARLGLCQAAINWDENRGKFSTFAGKCIRNEINKEFIRRKPHARNISLETPIAEEGVLADVLEGESYDSIGVEDSFYNYLTKEERTVFSLNNMGLSSAEIAESTGYGVQKVLKLLRIIKLKWRKFDGE